MNINESDYLWASPSEPLSVVLTAGENPITFDNTVRIYKIKGTGNIKIYEDDTKETIVYEGELPYKLEERACFDSLFIEVEEEKTIQLVVENGYFKDFITPYLNTRDGMTSIYGDVDDSSVGVNIPFTFKMGGSVISSLSISTNLYINFSGISSQLNIYQRDGRSTEILSQVIDVGENQILKVRFEGYTYYNDHSEGNRIIYEFFVLPEVFDSGMFLNFVKRPNDTGTKNFVHPSGTIGLDFPNHDQVAFYPKDSNGSDWRVAYENYQRQTVQGSPFKLIFKYGGKNHKFTGAEFVEVPMTEYDAASFIEYGGNVFPSSEYYTPLQDPKVYCWTGGTEAILMSDVAVCYPYPSDITFHMNLEHPTIFGISGCDMEYTGNVGVLVSVDEGVTYDEEVPAASWLSTGWVNLWSRLPASKILYIKLRLHGDATVTNFKIHYMNTEE